jgi:hypothetical protein
MKARLNLKAVNARHSHVRDHARGLIKLRWNQSGSTEQTNKDGGNEKNPEQCTRLGAAEVSRLSFCE